MFFSYGTMSSCKQVALVYIPLLFKRLRPANGTLVRPYIVVSTRAAVPVSHVNRLSLSVTTGTTAPTLKRIHTWTFL